MFRPLKTVLKHIAIILLGVFLFPTLFQAVHVLSHHSANDSNSVSEFVCCGHNPLSDCSRQDGFKAPDEEKNRHCPICEYEFPVKSLPLKIKPGGNEFNLISNVVVAQCLHDEPGIPNSKQPRAPPLNFA